MCEELRERDRREVFRHTVRMQDEGKSVDDSRTRVAKEYGINVAEVREIESEGIAKNWPPL